MGDREDPIGMPKIYWYILLLKVKKVEDKMNFKNFYEIIEQDISF